MDPERVKKAQAEGLAAPEASAVAGLLTLLADPLRARIICALLVTDEMCVGDLALALDATEDSVSYGLRLLRNAGLVHRRREGRFGYYRLSDDGAREAIQASLAQLRTLVGLHPESAADDTDEG